MGEICHIPSGSISFSQLLRFTSLKYHPMIHLRRQASHLQKTGENAFEKYF